MRNYPFMQDKKAQQLLVEHGGSIGFDRGGRPVFQFRDIKSYRSFVKAFEESKKTAV